MVCCAAIKNAAIKKVRACRRLLIFPLLLCMLLVAGCMSSDEQQVRETANSFWQAVLREDMEAAKQRATWESAQYLKFLKSQQIDAQRFETGELLITDGVAEVATVLYGGDKGDMKIPVRTVLIRYESAWLVDVQKTMGSMVSGTMGSIVEQLNDFMQDGLKDLDNTLSNRLDELGKSLQQGLDGLQEELNKPQKPIPQPENKQNQQQAI